MRALSTRSMLLVLVSMLFAAGAMAQEPAAAEAASKAAPGLLPLLSRWFHVLSAIFLLGGSLYLRAVLMPAAKATLDDETHQQLRAAVVKRWGLFVHILITLLLITGFYNFWYIAIHLKAHEGQPTYHMLFGIKFLLAIAVFGLATMLTGRRSFSQKLQKNAGLWLGITIAMGVAIVLIAGYMKMM